MQTAALFFLLASIPLLQAQEKRFEKAMRPITHSSWVSILGGWDEEGRPYIKDMAYMTRWNPKAFSEQWNPYMMEHALPSGLKGKCGISVVRQSEGKGDTWSAHVPLVGMNGEEPYVSYKILGPGLKDLPGKLEAEGKEPPRLQIWEAPNGKFRWEVKDAWQVQVDATVNEGETWTLLGVGNNGQADLSRLPGNDPVVRIQGFRGLRCFADIYIPGKGLLEKPLLYLLPSFFQGSAWAQGQMSAYPMFMFDPGAVKPTDKYSGKVKIAWDLNRLPFPVEKLFPKRVIQMVFQAEWLKRSPDPRDRVFAGIRSAQILLRDPTRTDGLKLHRVTQEGESWKVEDIGGLVTEAVYPRSELRFNGGPWGKSSLLNDVDFKSYFVITAN